MVRLSVLPHGALVADAVCAIAMDDGEEPSQSSRVYLPGDSLKDGEELVMDTSAYLAFCEVSMRPAAIRHSRPDGRASSQQSGRASALTSYQTRWATLEQRFLCPASL